MLGRIAVLLLLVGLFGPEVRSAKVNDDQCGAFDEDQMLNMQSTFAIPTEHQWVARIVYGKGKNL